jgi:hypothetical protein
MQIYSKIFNKLNIVLNVLGSIASIFGFFSVTNKTTKRSKLCMHREIKETLRQ